MPTNTTARDAASPDRYDVVVAGGSWAGLSAAMQLARARRRVLVVDAGRPRNRFAHSSHGFLGQDGRTPAEILATARAQVLAYPTAGLRRDEATRAVRRDGGDFELALASGGSVHARRLVLATGIVDELPGLPGLRERWGVSVLHCPYCHGYEVADRRLGVLAVGETSVHQALLLPDWSADVTLFTNGAVEPTPRSATRSPPAGCASSRGRSSSCWATARHSRACGSAPTATRWSRSTRSSPARGPASRARSPSSSAAPSTTARSGP
jgi:alkyl hydroperoxide reductase subunit AhpF